MDKKHNIRNMSVIAHVDHVRRPPDRARVSPGGGIASGLRSRNAHPEGLDEAEEKDSRRGTDPTRARLRTIDCATRASSPPPLRSGDEEEDEDDVAFVRWTRSR